MDMDALARALAAPPTAQSSQEQAILLTGLGGWQGLEAGKERKKQQAAEPELEAYATRDRK